MNKTKTGGLSPRRYSKKEVREEIHDGEVRASEVVNRGDILIQFRTPVTKEDQKVSGRHFGRAVKWRRKKIDDKWVYILVVKLLFQDRNFELEEEHCICAWRTEMPPASKLPQKTIEQAQKDGTTKKVPNPLYRLKFMELTRKDRDKLKVLWE